MSLKTPYSPLALREGLDVGEDVAGAMRRAIPATLADGDVQRRLQALGVLQASLIGGRPSKSTDTTLRYKIELVGRGGIRPPTKIDVPPGTIT